VKVAEWELTISVGIEVSTKTRLTVEKKEGVKKQKKSNF